MRGVHLVKSGGGKLRVITGGKHRWRLVRCADIMRRSVCFGIYWAALVNHLGHQKIAKTCPKRAGNGAKTIRDPR